MITRINAQAASRPTDLVGNTPLLELSSISREVPGVRILGKAEWYNPGGSVKDRPALWMIRDGEKSGLLTPEKIIIDATSGNTGIAYAWIGAALGYKVKLCMPKNASEERKKILRAYGVEVVLTDPGEGSDGAIREARRLYAEDPERYFYPDQYKNPANPRSHYESTAPEIWEQTDGEVTHFVAGLGTSGTFVGTATRLREYNPEIKVVSFEPDSPFHGLEGMKHMASAIVPEIYDPTIADQNFGTPTEDAYDMVKRLAREEGILVGISAGGAVATSLRVARELESGVVVTVLCDSADKYLSESFWEESARAAEDRRGGRRAHPRPRQGSLPRGVQRCDGGNANRGYEDRGGRLARRERSLRREIAPLPHRPPGVHEARRASRRARHGAPRDIPFPPGPSGRAFRVRPGACLAQLLVHHRLGG
jgi:cysteine synthase B